MSYLAGVTSTGSKRPGVLWGGEVSGVPLRITASHGCRVRDDQGRDYIDFIMGLGAVALGYDHPEVRNAAVRAVEQGVVGSLPPVEEELLAARLVQLVPGMERVRLLKTGAEAVAAAVRLARVATRRERVLGCGYHGWLDWCSREDGVPAAVQRLYGTIPFNDPSVARERIRAIGDDLACVVVEPMVDEAPSPEWFQVLRAETEQVGALLIADEIKTGFRVALGGGVARWGGGIQPDLLVVGKALGNGFPIAAVGGRTKIMEGVARTWISSTLATESVALTAALAVLQVMERDDIPVVLETFGERWLHGLRALAGAYPDLVAGTFGIPAMCGLRFTSDDAARAVTIGAARRGLLFKRTAYNFVSAAHRPPEIDDALGILEESLGACRAGGTRSSC